MRRVAAHIASSSETLSSETYLLSSKSPHSVRIRDHHIEVRELLETTVEGIERWQSILVSPFPAGPAVLRRVRAAWHADMPAGLVACPTEAAFLQLASAVPGLTEVTVEKRRRGFLFRHCRGEYVELSVDGRRWETIALKDRELVLVRTALDALGLARLPASNYPEALSRICGAPSRQAT